ncbi:Manganese dependent endoglucanase Eg5A [Termitomyces sp. Mi166|nr:Manganese dependent endoglucanase Eg5A [Termitomyces sp. Mi166\
MLTRYTLGLLALASLVIAQQPLYGQCGGVNWTGGTTCVSGAVCTELNDYYYQCLPGPASTTASPSTSTISVTTTSSLPIPSGGLPFLGGVNMAGYDFTVHTDGSFTGTGVDPPVWQFAHFASQGVNIFRIPFAWQLMTPTVGGTIDSSFFSRYDATVQAALNSATQPYVILDLHNYARWNGAIISQGGPTDAQFSSLWSQLATKYKNNPKIIFGLMNEPHDLSVSTWVTSVQAAVNAIRAAGATSQYYALTHEGSSWSSAQALPSEAGPALAQVTDPAGGKSKLIFDGEYTDHYLVSTEGLLACLVHKYLDSDNSGTHADCTTSNVDVLTTLLAWLKANGNRQALLSETGGGNTQSCYTNSKSLKAELAYVKVNSANLVGFTVWSAGSFDTTYVLTLTPNADGTDQPLWTQAGEPLLLPKFDGLNH